MRRRPLTRLLRRGDRVWVERDPVLGSRGWEAPRCDLIIVLSARAMPGRFRQLLELRRADHGYWSLTTRDCVRVVRVW